MTTVTEGEIAVAYTSKRGRPRLYKEEEVPEVKRLTAYMHYYRNREAVIEKKRAYYKANRERILLKKRTDYHACLLYTSDAADE